MSALEPGRRYGAQEFTHVLMMISLSNVDMSEPIDSSDQTLSHGRRTGRLSNKSMLETGQLNGRVNWTSRRTRCSRRLRLRLKGALLIGVGGLLARHLTTKRD